MSGAVIKRNPGIPLDLGWVNDSIVNTSAVQRRAQTFGSRRSVKKTWQAAWLLRAITMIDLTTLAGDDTPGKVRRLCAKARQPLRQDIIAGLDANALNLTAAAVCVYHQRVADAVDALQGSGIPAAAVSTGFPAGLSPFEQRIAEIHQSVRQGAKEIDVVISRERVLRGDWPALYDEVCQMRQACGDAHIKTILATGELGPLWHVAAGKEVLHQPLQVKGTRRSQMSATLLPLDCKVAFWSSWPHLVPLSFVVASASNKGLCGSLVMIIDLCLQSYSYHVS